MEAGVPEVGPREGSWDGPSRELSGQDLRFLPTGPQQGPQGWAQRLSEVSSSVSLSGSWDR